MLLFCSQYHIPIHVKWEDPWADILAIDLGEERVSRTCKNMVCKHGNNRRYHILKNFELNTQHECNCTEDIAANK